MSLVQWMASAHSQLKRDNAAHKLCMCIVPPRPPQQQHIVPPCDSDTMMMMVLCLTISIYIFNSICTQTLFCVYNMSVLRLHYRQLSFFLLLFASGLKWGKSRNKKVCSVQNGHTLCIHSGKYYEHYTLLGRPIDDTLQQQQHCCCRMVLDRQQQQFFFCCCCCSTLLYFI